MPTVQELCDFLDQLCPPALAEEWDNVGLLVGDACARVQRVMTCLTITEESANEAVAQQASLIISHHPLPFRPLRRLTTATPEGRCLLALAGAGIAVYSPHTAYDSAIEGINQQLAEGFGLTQIAPLKSAADAPAGSGTGRYGVPPAGTTLSGLAASAQKLLRVQHAQIVGDPGQQLRRVGLACGAADDLHELAREAGCDCLLTGEARFHSSLAAQATGMGLILVGHYASERQGVEQLAQIVQKHFPELTVWASRDERDPLIWLTQP